MLGEIVRVVAGLAVTLGLIGVAVVALRRFGPETLRRLQGSRAVRRLAVDDEAGDEDVFVGPDLGA